MPPSDRPLPSNVEAEKSVIGALLIDGSGFAQLGGLERRHFYRDAHRRIYGALVDLVDAGKPADVRLLVESLEQRGELEDVGGHAYVGAMLDGVPRSTNVKYYAEIVREKWTLRQLEKFGRAMMERALDSKEPARVIIGDVDSQLTGLASESQLTTGAAPVSADLSALMADLDYRVQHRGQISGLPTGFPEVDLLTHGWQRRQMVVVAGQTSFGKSVLALNFAHAIAAAGHRVVYYSYEMERKELEYRLLAALAEIPLTRILWGNLSDREYTKLSTAMDAMHDLPLEINDGTSRSIADVRSECRAIKADRGLAAVVLDHFQLMDGAEGENRTQQLGAISRRIQGLGMELDVTTFTLSQLTLPPADANREPQLDDLRECKSLGHDANQVAMLHPYKPSEARSDVSVVPFKLIFRKNRGGRLGTVPLHLERDYVRFVPGEAPVAPVKEPKEPKKSKTPDRW